MHELKQFFMQTTKRPTGLRTAAADYETLVQQAINKVTGFHELYKELERAINVSGKSKSTLTNYSPHLAPMPVIFVAKSYLTCLIIFYAVITNGYFMRVTTQIFYYTLRSCKRTFGIHYPVCVYTTDL